MALRKQVRSYLFCSHSADCAEMVTEVLWSISEVLKSHINCMYVGLTALGN